MYNTQTVNEKRILAITSSPIKLQRLHESVGDEYVVNQADVVSDCDEKEIQQENSRYTGDRAYPVLIALGKLRLALTRIPKSADSFVIATDSVNGIGQGNEKRLFIANKPVSQEEAIHMLELILNYHAGFTLAGTAIGHTSNMEIFECMGTELRFPVKKPRINLARYVKENWEVLKTKAGAFDMFGLGKHFVDEKGTVTVASYTLNTPRPEVINTYPASELFSSPNSEVRKSVSGTYPSILHYLLYDMQRLLNRD